MKFPVSFWLQIIALAIITAAVANWAAPRDDTDDGDQGSGMTLYRHAHTGCEYLGSPLGNLTPRLDRGGKQICEARP